jgi:hypothetical protein
MCYLNLRDVSLFIDHPILLNFRSKSIIQGNKYRSNFNDVFQDKQYLGREIQDWKGIQNIIRKLL